jgi:dimethylargininase
LALPKELHRSAGESLAKNFTGSDILLRISKFGYQILRAWRYDAAAMFTRAIVRAPAANLAEGLTSSGLGAPNYQRALRQHEAYCMALEQCGLKLTRLEADERYPDSCFVEDTAVIIEGYAVLTRPGAPSRAGEVESMQSALANFFPSPGEIQSPGTLDGGDVCEAGDHFFIGISERTNEEGARQLAQLLTGRGRSASFVDIRGLDGLLHLKSGLAHLGDNRLAIAEALANHTEFKGYHQVPVESDELYGANCVKVNDYLLVAAGYSKLEARLRRDDYQIMALEMSEFQKMDGGLSCLSLRF